MATTSVQPPSPAAATSTSHPPTVSLTPATPITTTAMKDNQAPTDSATALVEKQQQQQSASPSSPSAKAPPTTASPSPNMTTTTTTPPAASTSTSKPQPQPPAASRNPPRPATQKKKRKRRGLAGLLLAMGCLSADSFEEDEATVKKREEMLARARANKQATTGAGAGGGGAKAEEKGSEHKADATGTTLVGEGEKDKALGTPAAEAEKREEVVVKPVEPVTLPPDETAGLTSSAVQPPGSGSALLGTPVRPHPARRPSEQSLGTTPQPAETERGTSSNEAGHTTTTSGGYSNISDSEVGGGADDQGEVDEGDYDEEYEDEEDRLIAQGGIGIPIDENGNPAPLLPAIDKAHHGRKCLVLDLDETLLHSSFKMLPTADYIVPVEIESQVHNVYVIKRPGVDHFLTEMGKIYEVVVFTASLSKYADPVLDMLDPNRVVRHRLFRESCYNHKGNYVKDLSQLGRDLETSIIIDNSPASYIFHPTNAVPVSTWFNDPHDTELTDLCPFLVDLATVDDVRGVLDSSI